MYAIVRKDIPVRDQIVQIGHACLCAGKKFEWSDTVFMVVLQVENQEKLLEAAQYLDCHGTKYEIFFEPDDNYGYTALATEPICGEQRKLFRKYKLWE